MAEPRQPIQTIRYKTYLKEALREALAPVFTSHADPLFRDTKVTVETPFTEAHFPAIVIRFYERTIHNAGIGHHEFLPDPNFTGRLIRYKHYMYNGDVEFAVYALSSLDRDLLSDSIVQTLTMADIEAYTNQFLARIYAPDIVTEPASVDHMVNINTDQINGFGESQAPAPWNPEDVLVYQTAYRIGVSGEFYSRTPGVENYGQLEQVDVFPYDSFVGEPKPEPGHPGVDRVYGPNPKPDGPDDDVVDPAVWESS